MKTTITHTFELEDKDSCEGCGCYQSHWVGEIPSKCNNPEYKNMGIDLRENFTPIRPDICKEDQERQTNEKD